MQAGRARTPGGPGSCRQVHVVVAAALPGVTEGCAKVTVELRDRFEPKNVPTPPKLLGEIVRHFQR